jgi:hypothetical protein
MQNINSKISFNTPSNKTEWDILCYKEGNLLQATHFDEVQAFYNQTPVYIEMFDTNKMIGGVKLYYFTANKLPWLFKQTTIFGEPIISSELALERKENLLSFLSEAVIKFNQRHKIVVYNQSSFYGGPVLNILGGERKSWGVFYIDLLQSEESFLKGMHTTHRRMINKAKKSELVFEKLDNIDLFLSLLTETYRRQKKDPPNSEFIRNLYTLLYKNDLVALYFVKDAENRYLSSALVQKFGKIADYSFGGNTNNNLGAGHYLHYKICSELKSEGYNQYYLGQVANEIDEDNLKFTEGISRFKRSFGGYEKQGIQINLVIRKINYKIWKLITKIRNKK